MCAAGTSAPIRRSSPRWRYPTSAVRGGARNRPVRRTQVDGGKTAVFHACDVTPRTNFCSLATAALGLGAREHVGELRQGSRARCGWRRAGRSMADGEIVVIHDERVDRTTNGSGQVSEMSFAALRGLDAGDGEQIPRWPKCWPRCAGCRDQCRAERCWNRRAGGGNAGRPTASAVGLLLRPRRAGAISCGLPKHSLRTVAAPMASGCASRLRDASMPGRQHRRSDRDACAHSHDSQLGLPLSRLYRRRRSSALGNSKRWGRMACSRTIPIASRPPTGARTPCLGRSDGL